MAKHLLMQTECAKCSTLYNRDEYSTCPRCEEELHFDRGLEASRTNKTQRSK